MSYHGDDTYLEAFIESLSTLPHEIKRNLELMKDLDVATSSKADELRQLQQQYIHFAEQKLLEMQLVHVQDHNVPSENYFAVATLHDANQYVIPTTEEMQDYVTGRHDDSTSTPPTTTRMQQLDARIETLSRECLQKSDEKVAIAEQAHRRIDATVQRLDNDLRAMEKLLQAQGDMYGALMPTSAAVTTGGGGGGNNNSIGTVLPGLPGTTHNAAGSAAAAAAMAAAAAVAVPKPNSLAAALIDGEGWILTKIISHDMAANKFTLADEDVESNKVYHLNAPHVVVLSDGGILHNAQLKLSKGDAVYAVYPDTTSFYPATVVQAPPKKSPYVLVSFVDDSDEFGVTHDKAIPLQHVMLPPSHAR